jgi:hypothetical protein
MGNAIVQVVCEGELKVQSISEFGTRLSMPLCDENLWQLHAFHRGVVCGCVGVLEGGCSLFHPPRRKQSQ